MPTQPITTYLAKLSTNPATLRILSLHYAAEREYAQDTWLACKFNNVSNAFASASKAAKSKRDGAKEDAADYVAVAYTQLREIETQARRMKGLEDTLIEIMNEKGR